MYGVFKLNPRISSVFFILIFSSIVANTISCTSLKNTLRIPATAPSDFTIEAFENDSEGYTMIAIPDSQVVMDKFPHIWQRQTQWIAENASRLNLKFVVHEGDITDFNTEREWQDAKRGFDNLKSAGVPYSVTVGNHDLHNFARVRDSSLFNKYFKVGDYRRTPTFGGVFESNKYDNNFHRFSVGGVAWLVLSLEFGPRDKVVEWANTVIEAHPDHRVLIVTHCYLNPHGQRVDRNATDQEAGWNPHAYGMNKAPGDVNDGQELWDKLAKRHANVTFVLSGHVLDDGAGYLVSSGDHGNSVHQILANYQYNTPYGGNGFMRIMQFYPQRRLVKVLTYSPHVDVIMGTNFEENNFYIENIDLNKPSLREGQVGMMGR